MVGELNQPPRAMQPLGRPSYVTKDYRVTIPIAGTWEVDLQDATGTYPLEGQVICGSVGELISRLENREKTDPLRVQGMAFFEHTMGNGRRVWDGVEEYDDSSDGEESSDSSEDLEAEEPVDGLPPSKPETSVLDQLDTGNSHRGETARDDLAEEVSKK